MISVSKIDLKHFLFIQDIIRNIQFNNMSEFIVGKNIFITGAAGTGKSYNIARIVKEFDAGNIKYGLTASTGCASYLIRGRTLHSFLGIGIATETVEKLVSKCKSKQKLRQLDYLIVDEISMIDDGLLDKASLFLQKIRGNTKTFGGIYMIFVGDFAQIPPVSGKYCFQSSEWKRSDIHVHKLTHNHRQAKDPIFQEILTEARAGKLSDKSIEILKTRKKLKKIKTDDGDVIEPTILFAKNVDVDKINEQRYKKILIDKKDRLYNDEISLCVGTQVVLNWNINQESGLINGSRGIVTNIDDPLGPLVLFKHMKYPVQILPILKKTGDVTESLPLVYAWALTIHKSQGMTLDYMVVDLGPSIFECGQAYTALSRAKDLQSIAIINICKESFKTNENVRKQFIEAI